MRKILISTLFIISCCVSFAQGKGIVFYPGNLSGALAKAKAEGKLVFVDCYKQKCGPCKFAADNFFPDELVGEYFNTKFISMSVDCESDTEIGKELKSKYKPDGYPTFLILDTDGKEVCRWCGVLELSPDEFLAHVQYEQLTNAQREEIKAGWAKTKSFKNGIEYLKLLSPDIERVKTIDNLYDIASPEQRFDNTFLKIALKYSDINSQAFSQIISNYTKVSDIVGENFINSTVKSRYYEYFNRIINLSIKPGIREVEHHSAIVDSLKIPDGVIGINERSRIASMMVSGDYDKLIKYYNSNDPNMPFGFLMTMSFELKNINDVLIQLYKTSTPEQKKEIRNYFNYCNFFIKNIEAGNEEAIKAVSEQ